MAMTLDPTTAVAIVVPTVTALVWLIRLEGRVNTGEVVTRRLQEDVTYIRERIDEAIERRAHRRE